MKTKERFLKFVLKCPSGCHEWQSTIKHSGYGQFWLGKPTLAHRVAYELFIGQIPEGLQVLHTCDNRKCVNPKHLYAGTPRDNVLDKVERFKGMWGRMKIPFSTVQEARRLYATGLSQQKVADLLGIKQIQVSRYVRGIQRKEH